MAAPPAPGPALPLPPTVAVVVVENALSLAVATWAANSAAAAATAAAPPPCPPIGEDDPFRGGGGDHSLGTVATGGAVDSDVKGGVSIPGSGAPIVAAVDTTPPAATEDEEPLPRADDAEKPPSKSAGLRRVCRRSARDGG